MILLQVVLLVFPATLTPHCGCMFQSAEDQEDVKYKNDNAGLPVGQEAEEAKAGEDLANHGESQEGGDDKQPHQAVD
jgi:hypothetical protein